MNVENRFEGCKVLWGKRYRGKFSGMIRYAEAVIETKDGKLYYVDANIDLDADVIVAVREVVKFDRETKEVKKKPGFVKINSKEWKYLKNLLLEERDGREP